MAKANVRAVLVDGKLYEKKADGCLPMALIGVLLIANAMRPDKLKFVA